jgi:sec-independent protein translocase protein TatB
MFDIGSPELLLVAVVAIVVSGPKDWPKAMRLLGHWIGRGRSVMRQFRSGFDAMVREAELQEMEKRWAEENKRIMQTHPSVEPAETPPPASETGIVEHDAAPSTDTTAPAAPEDDEPVMTVKPRIDDEPELPLGATRRDEAQ